MLVETLRQKHHRAQVHGPSPERAQQLALDLHVPDVPGIFRRLDGRNRLIQLDPDHLGGRRVELQPHRFAVEVSGLAIPLLALALVHGQLHRAAVGAMERLVDVQHRLHVVFARGDLVEGRTWIAQRGAVDGDAADTFDIRAEHLLRVQFLGDLHPRLAPGVG